MQIACQLWSQTPKWALHQPERESQQWLGDKKKTKMADEHSTPPCSPYSFLFSFSFSLLLQISKSFNIQKASSICVQGVQTVPKVVIEERSDGKQRCKSTREYTVGIVYWLICDCVIVCMCVWCKINVTRFRLTLTLNYFLKRFYQIYEAF